jgi:hypothetical protein
MVARRKVRRARRKRSFSINLLETGAGLAFLDAANAGTAVKQALGPEGPAAALTTLTSAFKKNKNDFIKIGVGTLAAKLVFGTLGGPGKTLGSVGPLKLRI